MAVCHIDGSSHGNPGPAACAAVFHGRLGDEINPYFIERIPHATSNEAEYHALLLALRECLNCGERQLHAYTDSQVLARQIQGRYKVRAPNLKPLHERAMALIGQLDLFVIQYIPREQNRQADRRAYRA